MKANETKDVKKVKINMDINQKEEKPIDLDDVLVNELGQFGRFQFFNILLVAAPMIMSAWLNEYVFSVATIPYRCKIPGCDPETDSVYHPEWITNAIPKIGPGFSSCWRYAPAKGSNATVDYCPVNAFNHSKILTCDNIIYFRKHAVVNDFDLGCREWLRALAGSFNSIGTLLVMPICGFISDRYGRKVALILSLFNMGLFGLIRAFSVNYPMFLALQLLQTALGAGTFSTAYIFAAELVGPKYRMAIGATCSSMFALGQVTLGGIAWLVPNWRHMTLILFVPCFFFISYYWILSESVRWLLSMKKYDQARIILEKVARVNGKQINESSLRALTKPPTPMFSEKTHSNLIATIFQSPILMRRICTTPVWWISTTFIYYGLSINSTSLSETTYLNYMLTGAIELPGFFTAVILVNRIGRKPTLSGGFFLCAICNIAFAFIQPEKAVIRLVLYLLGKYGIAMVFTSLYLFTSELYPTEYRHTLLAFSSMVGRIGSIVAPLTPVLKQYWPGIPAILFGCMGLISGFLILTQPETLGTKLPDTLEEAEALGLPETKTKQIIEAKM